MTVGAWAEVNRLRLHEQINKPEFKGPVTFAHLAQHYIAHELGDLAETIDPNSASTISGNKRKASL